MIEQNLPPKEINAIEEHRQDDLSFQSIISVVFGMPGWTKSLKEFATYALILALAGTPAAVLAQEPQPPLPLIEKNVPSVYLWDNTRVEIKGKLDPSIGHWQLNLGWTPHSLEASYLLSNDERAAMGFLVPADGPAHPDGSIRVNDPYGYELILRPEIVEKPQTAYLWGDGKVIIAGILNPTLTYKLVPQTQPGAIEMLIPQAAGQAITYGWLIPAGLSVAVGLYGITGGLQQSIEGPVSIAQPDGTIHVLDSYGNNLILRADASAVQNSAEGQAAGRPSFPPPKDYCGENLSEYYAHELLDEIVAIIMRDQWNTNGTLGLGEIFTNHWSVTETRDQIKKRLEEKNCYFYPQGGSVFSDYKKMRPENMNSIRIRFNKNMTTEQALQIAREIVAEWW